MFMRINVIGLRVLNSKIFILHTESFEITRNSSQFFREHLAAIVRGIVWAAITQIYMQCLDNRN